MRLLVLLALGVQHFVPPAAPVRTPEAVDRFVTAGGYRLHYVEAGTGPVVVLLHGLGANVRAWRSTVPALSADHRVIAIDLLGFGQSDKPQIPYRVGTLVDSVTAALDELQISSATVVGNSLGGWVAAMLTTTRPERVEKLVLVDAAGYGQEPGALVRDYLRERDPGTLALAQRMVAGMTPEQQKAMQMLVASMVAQRMSRSDGFALAALAESIYRGDDLLGAEVKRITAPTLVVWGRDDRIVPLHVADALAQDIPGAKKVVLDGCGHRPQTECATEFNAEVRKFLKATAARSY